MVLPFQSLMVDFSLQFHSWHFFHPIVMVMLPYGCSQMEGHGHGSPFISGWWMSCDQVPKLKGSSLFALDAFCEIQ